MGATDTRPAGEFCPPPARPPPTRLLFLAKLLLLLAKLFLPLPLCFLPLQLLKYETMAHEAHDATPRAETGAFSAPRLSVAETPFPAWGHSSDSRPVTFGSLSCLRLGLRFASSWWRRAYSSQFRAHFKTKKTVAGSDKCSCMCRSAAWGSMYGIPGIPGIPIPHRISLAQEQEQEQCSPPHSLQLQYLRTFSLRHLQGAKPQQSQCHAAWSS